MDLADWYRFRNSEGYHMGAPSRQKRKTERSKNMAGRAMILKGIWDHISAAQMKNSGEPLSAALVSAVNEHRTDPCPTTLTAVHKALEDFAKFWEPVYTAQNSGKKAAK